MDIDDFRVYSFAMNFAEKVWQIVNSWNTFSKDTIGKQFVRSSDSIAANLSEGFGRYHYKEAKHFCYYSRGSLYETKTWLKKAKNRGLIEDSAFSSLDDEINLLGKMLNKYINTIGNT